ncbi:hypothetical protein GGS23DRAFT_571368 [Durotheca rogersii]|uniref:uncharacterized protein n=1 Tax=Durotheca rogersii TaxID=419775 RepID=UPI002220C237|nr:uncharacterized protein GGS23DRAFT_571368 [Durotheca rogersii]KAI5862692.1 hypothetical protein GGS23DRAFT_571368 [Durotheca rogersii]
MNEQGGGGGRRRSRAARARGPSEAAPRRRRAARTRNMLHTQAYLSLTCLPACLCLPAGTTQGAWGKKKKKGFFVYAVCPLRARATGKKRGTSASLRPPPCLRGSTYMYLGMSGWRGVRRQADRQVDETVTKVVDRLADPGRRPYAAFAVGYVCVPFLRTQVGSRGRVSRGEHVPRCRFVVLMPSSSPSEAGVGDAGGLGLGSCGGRRVEGGGGGQVDRQAIGR